MDSKRSLLSLPARQGVGCDPSRIILRYIVLPNASNTTSPACFHEVSSNTGLDGGSHSALQEIGALHAGRKEDGLNLQKYNI